MINNFGKQFLRNNQQLKAPNVTQYIDQKQMQYRMQEMKKIVDNIEYFAQHYFYIISLDQGKKIIKLYPKQAGLVKQMTQRRRLICLAARQCGKCLDINSIIKIRNKKTGLVEEITIGQFFNRVKMSKQNKNGEENENNM